MKIRNLAVISLLLIGLTLAACTRQASTAAVPTQPASQPTTSSAEDPTMAAVRQTAAVRATEAVVETQAAAAQGAGGGAESTPAVEATPAAKELPSETPAALGTSVAPVATATPVPTAASAAVPCPNPYIVKQGDWIYKIARACSVTPAALLAANAGISPNFIVPGQKLNMPGSTVAQPFASACTGNYTVVRGDTLFNIAYRCGLTTEELAAVNAIRYPFVIHPGDVLKFP